MRDLSLEFETEFGTAKVLDRVTFTIGEGEVFGLVGETGCGKTVTALTVLRLLPSNAKITTGNVKFLGEELLSKTDAEMERLRGTKISMVFQDPATSLNPVFSVGEQITRVVRTHEDVDKRAAETRAVELFKRVGLPDPETVLRSYPHELSGGMQQRVMISMALACRPRLLIADEPTTAVDVTIQAQILELLASLRDALDMAMVFVTHDVREALLLANRIGLLKDGKLILLGAQADLLNSADPEAQAFAACAGDGQLPGTAS